MSEKQPRGIPNIRFPLTVPRQGVGDPLPAAALQFAGQIRMVIGVSGYTDGLYICDTNLAGTWGWYKVHGHGQPLNAQSFTGGISVSGNVGANTFSGTSATIGTISGGTNVGATNGTFINLTVTNRPWALVFKGNATVDVPSIAAGSSYQFGVTCTGVQPGDHTSVSIGSPYNGLAYYTYAGGSNAISVVVQNCTASAIDPPSSVYYVTGIR